ncbi:MAG: DMT family transporter [Clostridia bacterium]|nr:DMT family transporter [Clostridia bacterium]
MKNKGKWLSPVLLLLAAFIWGIAFTAQKAAAAVPTFALMTVRSSFAAVFLFAIIPIFDKLRRTGRQLFSKRGLDFTKSELIGGAVSGVFISCASIFQQFGISGGTDAGKAAFITALYVVIVPVFALIFRKRSPISSWIAVAVALVGFYLLCIDGEFKVAPTDLLILLCAAVFAMHIIAIDYFSPRCDGIRMSCIQFLFAALVSAALSLVFEPRLDFAVIGENFLSLLYLGIASSGIAYTLQILGQRDTPPAVASILLSLESVFGVLMSALLLGERMTPREYIGCAIVLCAVLLAEIDFKAIGKSRKK